MENAITDLIGSLGYVGIAFLMFAETVIPFIPSELIIPFAGFSASQGDLSLLGVVIAGTVGSATGAFVLYAVARAIGTERVEEIVKKYGKFAGLTGKDVKRADKFFDRYSKIAVTVGRVIPGIRSAISLPAGLSEMPVIAFLVCTVAGSAAWTMLLAYAGYVIGDNYEEIGGIVSIISKVIVVVVAGAIIAFIIRRRRKTA